MDSLVFYSAELSRHRRKEHKCGRQHAHRIQYKNTHERIAIGGIGFQKRLTTTSAY